MAVTILAPALATATGLTTAEAERLLVVATQIVQHFAEDAPPALLDESVIRIAAYMSGSQATTAMSSMAVGDGMDVKFRGPGSALRLSGAASILSPYRVYRADKVEAS